MTFEEVITCGMLAVNVMLDPPSKPPSGYTLLRRSFDVTTEGVAYARARVCFPYSQAEVGTAGIPEASLRLLHFKYEEWGDKTGDLDTVDNIVCGEADKLSPFVLGAFDLPPCSVSLNNAATYTGRLDVGLFSNTPQAAEMLVSNDGGFPGAVWQPYRTALPWTLSEPGERIVTLLIYAQFRDEGGDLEETERPPAGEGQDHDGTRGRPLLFMLDENQTRRARRVARHRTTASAASSTAENPCSMSGTGSGAAVSEAYDWFQVPEPRTERQKQIDDANWGCATMRHLAGATPARTPSCSSA